METDSVSQSKDSIEADDSLPLHRDPLPVGDSFDVSAAYHVPAFSSGTALAPRPIPSVEVGAKEKVNYQVVNGASKRGKPVLTDTRGYRYNKKPADCVDVQCATQGTLLSCQGL